MTAFFRVKNFERFQHYKDRSPPWIKLYNETLDDYAFGCLPDASKFHLVAIWLLASRSENKIPYDTAWVAKRINATIAVDLDILIQAGFLLLDQPLPNAEHLASTTQAKCLSREEGEAEGQEEKIDRIGNAGASLFTEGSKALTDAFWKAVGCTTPLDISPDYAGVDWRAVGWEKAGWTADLVEAETRRIGPGKPLSYYEKVFATAFARRQAPLPVVEIREAEKLTVNHGTHQNRSGGSLTAAIRRELAELEREESADLALPTGPLLSLSN